MEKHVYVHPVDEDYSGGFRGPRSRWGCNARPSIFDKRKALV